MIDPHWIVIAVFAWLGLAVFGLTVLWKTWIGLSRYFGFMYVDHAEELRKFGFPVENPMPVPLGFSKGYGRARIFLRLLIWGAPPIPETPKEASMAIRSAQFWSALGVTFWVLVFVGLSFLAIEFLFLFLVPIVLYFMVLNPSRWR